ncbi:WD40 repeat-like protein [Byssothecium circinans]|uniref:WD40 repeat-like protein n=1 Tax=Byssothecium circinans TaxID=147558 RepID=A0A6A5TN94_9PLEO|nr:WD40 repeat-like protein [Byssothecium circinans]
MSTQQLHDRASGIITHDALKRATATGLLYGLQPSTVNFSEHLPSLDEPNKRPPAHVSGVNTLAIDKFEGRYLLSGGADSSIAIWDLESQTRSAGGYETCAPLSVVKRTAKQHKLGITQACFYPFDSLAFLTSSYDHTVKIYSSETLVPSATFDLDSVVYNIALSPIASHLLVACATQSPHVRLIDLHSGASTHSLAGQTGAILSTAWSPTREHILASGSTDGTVKFWDVRTGTGALATLDLEDSTGVGGNMMRTSSTFSRNPSQAKAHGGPVNGLVWTEDGHHIVSCGHDNRIRVWDTDTGANTLANFGPTIRNSGLAPCIPVLAPVQNTEIEKDVLFYPNEHEILGFEMFEGKLFKRMRRPEQQKRSHEMATPASTTKAKGKLNIKDRATALAWRAHDVELYSAHADGSIAAWKPRTDEDVELDEEEEQEREMKEKGKKRKRGVLDDIYAGLMKKPITFGGL